MSAILLIEDKRRLVGSIAAALRKAGHAVTVAHDNDMVLANFVDVHPDLVLTDIVAPKKNSIKVIQSVRREDPKVPIIAMSSCGRRMKETILWAAARAGATEILRKPISDDVLVWIVERTLRDEMQSTTGQLAP